MSISFLGEDTVSLDLNNELATRILRAMGHTVDEGTCGSMSLIAAEAGILQARLILSGEDLAYLVYLSDIVDELHAAGRLELRWQ